MTDQEAEEFLDRHLDAISEHYPDVQILASRTDEKGDTKFMTRGTGNWFARRGMMREMLDNDLGDTISRSMKSEE